VPGVPFESTDLSSSQWTIAAGWKVAESQRTKFDADELLNPMSDGFAHPSHFSIAPLSQRDFKPGFFFTCAEDTHGGRSRDRTIVKAHACSQYL
jgi:hypothetical protein